jgi:cob(I)alamin adenosyltransferase
LRVFFAQFIKSSRYNEIKALECFGERVVCRQYGSGCWLRGEPTHEDTHLAREGLKEVYEIMTAGHYRVVILDEINVATLFRLLDVNDVLALIEAKPKSMELVLTGRGAGPRLIERADLVTEMQEVKHYYRLGVLAREGIES